MGTIIISALVVWFFTRWLTHPIQLLTDSAVRMAGGDLTTTVNMQRQDEIGVLAQTFNSMVSELRGLYQDLEGKVEARTRQLAAAAEVGRAATSILSTEDLLARIVDLVRERFGYYQVSVFLLDDSGQYASLREATGDVGVQLKARGYYLPVGSNSMIGWVAANKKSRISADVGDDPFYFKNELLPETRSEAAIPLRLGERVLGVLDVQSRELDAFGHADVEALQIMADQIAVGIENGRLFARQQRILQLEQLVASLTTKVHQSLRLDSILENAALELGRALQASRVIVRLQSAASEGAPAPQLAEAAPRPGNGHHEATSSDAPEPA